MSSAVLDQHLSACPDCAAWADAAAHATRLARMDARPVPDLSAAIAAAVTLPARRVLRRRYLLRFALLVIGLAQLAIGLVALSGDSIGMAMATHAEHEAAAWNLAVGVGLVAAASVPRRAGGLIPLLGTFLLLLSALSVRDYAAGVVSAARLASHFAALLGLLVLVLLDRAERALPSGWPAAAAGRGEAGDGSLRTVA